MFKPMRQSLLLLAMAVLWLLPTPAQANFCWRDSYGRGVGAIPNACPNGQNDAGLCYPNCNAGYTGVGPVCWQNCPSGYPDFGVGCSKPGPYGRGAGYPWKFGDALNDSGMYSRCESDNGGAGTCEKNGLIVYPKCRSGFHQVGCCICSPDCPGDLIDSGATCTKNTYGRGVGTIPSCGQGLQYDAGLCYQPARAGYTGVGPVAWGNCPASMPVNCGAGCASSSADCAQAITDQVTSVLEMVQTVVESVVTGGAGGALKAGVKAGVKTTVKNFASKLTKDQIRKKIKEQAKDMAESQIESLVAAAAGEEFDPTSLDPTGIGAIVNAYNHSTCEAPAANSTPPPPAVTQTSGPVVAGKLYTLTNKNSGQFLSVMGGSTDDLALIVQWPSDGGDNQKWWFQEVDDNTYRFISKRSDKVLDVRGRSTADGADIIQYTNANSDNQLWLLEPQADGYYVIVSKNSGKAFAVSGGSQVNGTQVIQWPKSTQDHFKWRFDPAESPQATTLAECASYDFKTFRDQVGKQVSCRCAQVGGGSVWGTDTYTDDSNVCAAAVYGGIIPANFSSGGEAVKVTIQAGQPSYAAGTRRGITAKSYGSWPGSFSVSR